MLVFYNLLKAVFPLIIAFLTFFGAFFARIIGTEPFGYKEQNT